MSRIYRTRVFDFIMRENREHIRATGSIYRNRFSRGKEMYMYCGDATGRKRPEDFNLNLNVGSTCVEF